MKDSSMTDTNGTYKKRMMEYDCMHAWGQVAYFRDNGTTLVQEIYKKDAVPKISWEHLEWEWRIILWFIGSVGADS